MGGLSYGFAQNGFEVTGVDISEKAGRTYIFNRIGTFQKRNLMKKGVEGNYKVIIGGPPCEPWSCLNLTRRKENHPRYNCLSSFFREVHRMKPLIFVMENVPAIRKDPILAKNLQKIGEQYSAMVEIVDYSNYGAAFARKRFFAIGIRKEIGISPLGIMSRIKKTKAATIRKAIWDLRNIDWNSATDHVWPRVKTIRKYLAYYQTGKFGWYILNWDSPSPSFGNITKTYILHPDSFVDSDQARPISVREALRIVGFPDKYGFPSGIDMRTKYEMIADSVSPVFSLKLAKAIKDLFCPYLAG